MVDRRQVQVIRYSIYERSLWPNTSISWLYLRMVHLHILRLPHLGTGSHNMVVSNLLDLQIVSKLSSENELLDVSLMDTAKF